MDKETQLSSHIINNNVKPHHTTAASSAATERLSLKALGTDSEKVEMSVTNDRNGHTNLSVEFDTPHQISIRELQDPSPRSIAGDVSVSSSPKKVRTSRVQSDPLRHKKQQPSLALPLAFIKSFSMGEEFPLVFDPDYFYHKYSKDDLKDVDQYVHYRNIGKSFVLSVSVFGFGGVLIALMSIYPEHFEKWYALSFLMLWIVYAIAILWTVRDSKNRYIYRILTSVCIRGVRLVFSPRCCCLGVIDFAESFANFVALRTTNIM